MNIRQFVLIALPTIPETSAQPCGFPLDVLDRYSTNVEFFKPKYGMPCLAVGLAVSGLWRSRGGRYVTPEPTPHQSSDFLGSRHTPVTPRKMGRGYRGGAS